MKRILVTGATGYVGGRLVRSLLDAGLQVRVLVRDERKALQHPWSGEVEMVVGSALDESVVRQALAGVDTAYYLLHSMNGAAHFDQVESEMAGIFGAAAAAQGVRQIVYLGGIANDTRTSRHLKSRAMTGEVLGSSGVPVIELRAGMIIGSGSASFEMLRHLTHRLPVMTTPKWVSNRTQPIAIRDVLHYLVACATLPQPVTGVFDVGGPEVLTYEEMMQTFAATAGLRKRLVIKVPVLTPFLSSLWVGLVTPVPTSLARPLVESLISEVVVDPAKSVSRIVDEPAGGLTPLRTAIGLALEKVSLNQIETRWTDATAPTAPWQRAQGDPEWAGASEYRDVRERDTTASPQQVWDRIERIGGETGWYGVGYLWYLRGLADRLFGGVGLRRGRRDPYRLRVGDSLDFWRVEECDPPARLRLYAEMILPGKAWLDFVVTPTDTGAHIIQTATFQPSGLGGHLYWRSVAPFHTLVFPTMLRNICRAAESGSDGTQVEGQASQ